MISNILVTGGAGFIGSHFIRYVLKKTHKNYNVINIDKLSYSSNLNRLNKIIDNKKHVFIKGDICNKRLVREILTKYEIEAIINFAAESSVSKSIKGPSIFIKTNVLGTHNLLNEAYKHWFNSPFKIKPAYKTSKFIHISTDEVYGSIMHPSKADETHPYAPNNPYSASKAASDMIVRSYINTYGINALITHSTNNYGPGQHQEKLIPHIILSALNNKNINIHGDGDHIRDWIYVKDNCKAIYKLLKLGKVGEHYNIASNNEISTIKLTNKICNILDYKLPNMNKEGYNNLIKNINDRPGNDKRYAIDFSKLTLHTHWTPRTPFDKGIEKTINWYIKHNKKD